MKEEVFDIFEAYQNELKATRALDWTDFHECVLEFLEDGTEPNEKFSHIFIDEGQHFGPTWIKILKSFLKPEGQSLFVMTRLRASIVSLVG